MTHQAAIQAECIFNRTTNKFHWSPTSQAYAPADILESLLSNAWIPSPQVVLTQHALSSWRYTNIYTFTLRRDNSYLEVSVVENPVVLRLIRQHVLEIH